jgi:nitrite reductase/ring-hydroxylating ferredoxin subunit
MHIELSGDASCASCAGCALLARRDFLRNATGRAASILLALGGLSSAASAQRIVFIAPGGMRGDEASYPIPPADGVQIDKGNGTILTRWQNKVYVYSLGCPHQNTALRWYEKDSRFECPKHHSRFGPDGVYVPDSGRATRGLDRFAVRQDGPNVIANLERLYRQDDNRAEWDAAFVTP